VNGQGMSALVGALTSCGLLARGKIGPAEESTSTGWESRHPLERSVGLTQRVAVPAMALQQWR
jgi:hypothetical protein